MHLWTEYEGNTLAGYPIGRLSRSEGRSAMFLTTTEEGKPALLRLTESHFDEGELIGRWRKAAAVSHPGLQEIWHSGQTTFDGVALACCLLEPADASLSDVLRERVLTVEETTEVAEAVAGALAALHAAGMIHEHVDATNVFAVGEKVKLRSDCARECTGDFEADTPEAREALRQRDVHDLGLLLRRCLTPQWQESSAMPLPAPFDRVVRRALNGSADAQTIAAEFTKPEVPAKPPAAVATGPVPMESAAAAGPQAVPLVAEAGRVRVAAGGAPTASGSAQSDPVDPVAAMRRKFVPANASIQGKLQGRGTGQQAISPEDVMAALSGHEASNRPRRKAVGSRLEEESLQSNLPLSEPVADVSLTGRLHGLRNKRRHNNGTVPLSGSMLTALSAAGSGLRRHRVWVAGAGAAALVGVALWHALGSNPASATASTEPVPVSQPLKAAAQPTPGIAARESATERVVTPASRPQTSSGTQAAWHVIAYTYRYEKQAQAKAEQLRQKYVSLEPQVFSPTGRAPYFVALGGPSDSASAFALRNRARQAGLPRDTYARNF